MKKAILKNGIIEIINIDSMRSESMDKEFSQYKNFISSNPPNYNKECQMLRAYYIESENEIIEKWEVQPNLPKIQKTIEELKKQLSVTDYVIIKVYEAKLSMSDAPYSQEYLDKTIQERQALRDKINELETLIK